MLDYLFETRQHAILYILSNARNFPSCRIWTGKKVYRYCGKDLIQCITIKLYLSKYSQQPNQIYKFKAFSLNYAQDIHGTETRVVYRG